MSAAIGARLLDREPFLTPENDREEIGRSRTATTRCRWPTTLLDQVVSFDGFAMAVNYGLDKLRFPAPLLVGDSVRLRVALAGLEEFPGGATLALPLTFESSGGGKPVCVAHALYRVFADER